MQGVIIIMKKANRLLIIFSIFISVIISSLIVFAKVNNAQLIHCHKRKELG